MATYAIGDIQGCYQSFQKLLNKIQFDPKADQLWLVGDLINRGLHSLETLRFIYAHQDSIHCVLGNHDLHFLAVESGVKKPSRKDKFKELLNADDRPELVAWLKTQPLVHFDPKLDFAMVHAGIPPQWSLLDALNFGEEVSDRIQSKKALKYFDAMYGNTPTKWSSDLTGKKRLRVITNYLTRMRYCKASGALDLKVTSPVGQQPAKLIPWFNLPREPLGCDLVFGHWASLEGKCPVPGFFALDTGCVWGGRLTALRLEDRTLISVKSAEKKKAEMF